MKLFPFAALPVLVIASLLSLCSAHPFSFWKASGPAPTPAPFTPTNIAGLKLWLKADVLALADAAAVSSWTDSSGTNNTATQATGTLQPTFRTGAINAKPIVRFDGADDRLVFPADPGSTTTTFVVAKTNIAAASAIAYSPFVITNSGAGLRLLSRTSSTNWGTFTSGDLSSGEDLVSGVANVLEMSTTSNATTLYRNGTQKAANTAQSSGGAGANYVGSEPGTGRFINADIAEIIIYNSILSTANRKSVEAHLGEKYAITITVAP